MSGSGRSATSPLARGHVGFAEVGRGAKSARSGARSRRLSRTGGDPDALQRHIRGFDGFVPRIVPEGHA